MREDCTCTCHGRTVECEPCYRLHTIVARMTGFLSGTVERYSEHADDPGMDGLVDKIVTNAATIVQGYWNTLVQTVAGDSSEWPAIERVQTDARTTLRRSGSNGSLSHWSAWMQRVQLVPDDYTCASCGLRNRTRTHLAEHLEDVTPCKAYYARVGLEAPVLP